MNKELLTEIDAVLRKHKVEKFEGTFTINSTEKMEYRKEESHIGKVTIITEERF